MLPVLEINNICEWLVPFAPLRIEVVVEFDRTTSGLGQIIGTKNVKLVKNCSQNYGSWLFNK